MAKKKGRNARQPEKEFDLYILEIDSWDSPYSFGINITRHLSEGPFWEFSSINISGNFILPEKISGKDITISLYGSRDFIPYLNSPQKYDDYEPKSIGHLTIRGKQRNGHAFIPVDMFSFIMSMLSDGRFKFLKMNGHALYRGNASIRSVSFHQEYDVDEW
ncbi:MAG: hypothetical protein H8E41_01280 [Desulfobulbaceae bacterium]|uniref:Uncharacterized protein n=1 Tax=Candidatus Desulfobia pelagia TaxID=2841692 RepID=A0A8J6TEU5_9BACT|nr:hypothetical protein [Candidatus Desulfobia pelagia]